MSPSPAPVQFPSNVQLLTSDYLIDGTIDGSKGNCLDLLGGHYSDIRVSSARLQATGRLSRPAGAASASAVAHGESLVAVIPRDDANRSFAATHNAMWKHPLVATLYVGPVVIRGTMLSADPIPLIIQSLQKFPVLDVEIDCLLPGSPLTGLKPPCAVIVGQHKHALLLRP